MRSHLTQIRYQKHCNLLFYERITKNGLPISYLPDNSDIWFWPPLMVFFIILYLSFRNHGPRRSQKKKNRRKDSRILLLKFNFIINYKTFIIVNFYYISLMNVKLILLYTFLYRLFFSYNIAFTQFFHYWIIFRMH